MHDSSQPADSTPLSLLERLQQPAAQDAWTRFVRLYTPLLYHFARSAGLQEADAADLVQDVFVLLLDKLPQFRHDGTNSFRSWLRVVTLNKWRERARRAALPMAGRDDVLASLADADPLETYWETDYRRHLVAQALHLMQTEFQPTTWQAGWARTGCSSCSAPAGWAWYSWPRTCTCAGKWH